MIWNHIQIGDFLNVDFKLLNDRIWFSLWTESAVSQCVTKCNLSDALFETITGNS